MLETQAIRGDNLRKNWRLIARLRELTLVSEGHRYSGMSIFLENIRRYSRHKTVVTATIGDTVVGWCAINRRRDGFAYIQVYVAQRYRRQGIATKLLFHAQGLVGSRKVEVMPHDDQAYEFFRKNGFSDHFLNGHSRRFLLS